jgi:steroid delta-isomerase-like uncharacterized protein
MRDKENIYMSLEENKTIARRLFEEVMNKGNQAVADELVAAEFVNHDPGPVEQPNREGFKQFFVESHATFPDLRYTIEDIVAEGDKVVVRWTLKGTHKGQWGPVAPTGKQFTTTGVYIFRIANGKLAELWLKWDLWSMAGQLGLLPQPGQ